MFLMDKLSQCLKMDPPAAELTPEQIKSAENLNPEITELTPEQIKSAENLNPEITELTPEQIKSEENLNPEITELTPEQLKSAENLNPEITELTPEQIKSAENLNPEITELIPEQIKSAENLNPEITELNPEQIKSAENLNPEINELTPEQIKSAENLNPEITELTPEQIKSAMNLTPGISESSIKPILPPEWSVHSNFRLLNCDITYIPCDSSEYNKVYNMLDTRKIHGKVITSIHRVENPYLYAMFLLKKAELKARFGQCADYRLFHGTRDSSMASIVLDNFDWRKSSNAAYNRGVYFTNSSIQLDRYTRFTILVTKVLVANPLKYDEYEDVRGQRMLSRWEQFSRNPNNLEPRKIAEHIMNSYKEEEAIEREPNGVPRKNHDTVISHDELITVKYDDHCFYPEYVISLGSTNPSDWPPHY